MPDLGKRNKNLLFGAVFVLAIFMSLAIFQATSAQTPAPPPPTGFENICATKDSQGRPIEGAIAKCVQQIYILALGLGSIVALLMIVLAGYRYMTAAGNAQQVENAKEAFASAFIGLIVIFVAFILLYLINPDLVKFRGLQFQATKTERGSSGFELEVAEAFSLLGSNNNDILAFMPGAVLQSDGSIVVQQPGGERLVLTPSLTSSLPYLFAQTLRTAGLDPSTLSIVEYEVSNPALLPDTLVALMNGDRPSRILIVVGSFFVFNADELHADTTGAELLAAVSLVALHHFGVDLNPPADGDPGGGAGSACGDTCRACDNNPAQCEADPNCSAHRDALGQPLCLRDAPPPGSPPADQYECLSPLVVGPNRECYANLAACQSECNLFRGRCEITTFCQAISPPPPPTGGHSGGCGADCNLCDGNVNACNFDFPRCYVNYQTADCALYSTINNQVSFTPCVEDVFCEDPETGERLPDPPEGQTCEAIDANMRFECYYPWQDPASIECDRLYRRERESCLADVQDGGDLPSCDDAQPGQACSTTFDNVPHCKYSDKQDAFYCGAAGSNLSLGYCLPGQTTNCYPVPDCINPQTVGERAACAGLTPP